MKINYSTDETHLSTDDFKMCLVFEPFLIPFLFHNNTNIHNINHMETITENLIQFIGLYFGHSDVSLIFGAGLIENLVVTSALVATAVVGATLLTGLSDELLAGARRWHGSIDDQYANIENLITTILAHQTAWGNPPQFDQLTDCHTQLTTLIPKCRTAAASSLDRNHRNILLKTAVGLCLTQVKLWAYGLYNENPQAFTLEDLHALGFLLPGETSGHRSRTEATDSLAEVKVTILSADMIRIVSDQAASEQAALTAHGWPKGVRLALIVIMDTVTGSEVYRQPVGRLHSEIQMPEGSHGRQFVIKAAFLKHPDDTPKFGPQPTFTMPYSTEDLIRTLDRQHHEEYEAHIREAERHRLELENLLPSSKPGGNR
jgi:hypothetical protein